MPKRLLRNKLGVARRMFSMLQRLRRGARRGRLRDRLSGPRSARLLMKRGELRGLSGKRKRRNLRRKRKDGVLSGKPDVKPNVSVRKKRRERGNGIVIVIEKGTGREPESVSERGTVMIDGVIGIETIATGDMMMSLFAGVLSAKLKISRTRQRLS